MRIPDEQQIFDELNADRPIRLASVEDFAKALEQSYDPIEITLKRFPGVTRKKAEAMAKAFEL